jgi:hypothetical protein
MTQSVGPAQDKMWRKNPATLATIRQQDNEIDARMEIKMKCSLCWRFKKMDPYLDTSHVYGPCTEQFNMQDPCTCIRLRTNSYHVNGRRDGKSFKPFVDAKKPCNKKKIQAVAEFVDFLQLIGFQSATTYGCSCFSLCVSGTNDRMCHIAESHHQKTRNAMSC